MQCLHNMARKLQSSHLHSRRLELHQLQLISGGSASRSRKACRRSSTWLANSLRYRWSCVGTLMHLQCCRCWEGRNNTSRPEWGLCNEFNGSEGASRIPDHSLVFSKGFRRGTTLVRSGIDENRRVFEDFEVIVEGSTMNPLDKPQGFGTMAYECSTTSRVKRDGKRRDPTVGSNWTKLKCEISSLESNYRKMRLGTRGWAWRGMETVPETP